MTTDNNDAGAMLLAEIPRIVQQIGSLRATVDAVKEELSGLRRELKDHRELSEKSRCALEEELAQLRTAVQSQEWRWKPLIAIGGVLLAGMGGAVSTFLHWIFLGRT